MKVLVSILLSVSLLVGSVGANFINSSCASCEGEKVCQCSQTVSVEKEIEHECTSGCCSMEAVESEDQISSCSCNGECCTPEFVKLEIPLILIFHSQTVELPQKDLSKDLFTFPSLSWFNERTIINKISEKPPPLIRAGQDIFSAFLC